MSGSHLSKDFFDLVKAIGESKSKQEEDRIIVSEIRLLKNRFQEKSLSKKVIKECLVRLIYVEMLGHDASFAYVHAIQLTAAGNLMQKKVGYLCASLTLSPEHEFRFMLVNQLQRDLGSANLLEVSTALIALAKLITVEMIPALLPYVQKLLDHEQSSVKQKAILALYRVYQLDHDAVDHLQDRFRSVLSDKDPSVMGSSLCILHELAKDSPAKFKDLVPSFVSILKQIIEHKLAKDFDYHRIPAPWIQIKLLKVLALLGANDQKSSEAMYDVLQDCMKRASSGIYVGYAIMYECVRTVTTIYPNPVLLDAAAASIARFIQSDCHNLKYLGVTGLASVVRDHPKYATEHQMIVLDCLEDPDETLKRKTLDLLFRMTNPVNAEVVVDKLLFFLKNAVDKSLRNDLVTRICQLAERFAPSNIWYVRTIAKVFELSGELVEAEVAHNLLRLLAEGVGEEDGEGNEDGNPDDAMRREACEVFYDMFSKSALPDLLLKVIFWTLGEYSYLMGVEEVPEVLEIICEAASRQGMQPATRGYAVSAVLKICAQLGRMPVDAAELVDKYSSSVDVGLQQKCVETREIARNLETLRVVLPVDASCEDLSDPDFSFLEPFVEQAVANGATAYSPPSQDESAALEYDNDELERRAVKAREEPILKYDAYEKPAPILNYAPASSATNNSSGTSSSLNANTNANTTSSGGTGSGQESLNLAGVKSVWGASGYGGTGAGAGLSSVPKSAATAASLEGKPKETSLPTAVAQPVPSYTLDSSTAAQPPKPASASLEPAKPKELSEREKMAAALFGGVSDSPTRSSTASPVNTTTRKRIAPTKPAVRQPEPEPEPEASLLDFDDDATAAPSSSGQTGGTMDLLMELSDPAPSTTHDAAQGESDLLGEFGGSSPPAVSAPPFRALSMNTQEFGQNWVTLLAEAKLAVQLPGAKSIHAIAEIFQRKLGFGIVEVIQKTEEAILAGCMEGDTQLVLVHAKQSSTGANIMIHTATAPLTEAARQACSTL